MSSHHIVRDEQEPALLIDDPFALSMDEVDQLLEWSPTVIVTQNALDEVLKWGIKIDVVVAKFNDLEVLKPKLVDQSPVQLLGFEDSDLLACAYIYLMDNNNPAVNVLADIYQSSVLDTVREFSKTIDSLVFALHQKWTFVKTGTYEKWVTVGHHFGIHPLVANTYFKSEGFYGDWDDEMFLEPIELTAEISGKIRLITNQKPFWIVESVSTDVYK
jgi:hypothetical protein